MYFGRRLPVTARFDAGLVKALAKGPRGARLDPVLASVGNTAARQGWNGTSPGVP